MKTQSPSAYLFIIAKYLLLPIALTISFLLSYQSLSIQYNGVGYGFGEIKLSGFPLEVILVTVSYYLLFFVLKNNRYRHFLALLPIISFYLFYDYYFFSFGKIFKLCDIWELPELIDVLPFWQIALYVIILLFIFFIIGINLTKRWHRYFLPALLITLTIFFITIKPALYLESVFKPYAFFGETVWSDQDTAQNGYITSLLFFDASMANSKIIANEVYGDGVEYEKSQDELIAFLKEKNQARNVHIVLLESFFNPTLFKKISYNDSVYGEKFSEMLGNNESAVISPVFGGFTAQAEFETLCGVPALHKYSSIEFNSFTGASVFCMPQLLKNTGYRVVATNGYKPSFFNTINAYKGVGFDEIYFPKQYAPKRDTYLSLVDQEKYIFDGDLFAQNLAFVKAHLEQKDAPPLFNFVLGVYGHLPFSIDEEKHPLRLKATSNRKKLDDEYHRASNQIYYRTQALATHLKQLIALDPHSLIIVMGDHVPKLAGTQFYKSMGYRNNEADNIHKPPAFFIVDGNFIKKDTLHQYDLMPFIFNYITDNQYCSKYPCQRKKDVLEYQYNMAMARALK